MIDLTSLKSPGWQRVVIELSSGAPDDMAYYQRLMHILTQVSTARKGILMVPTRAEGDEIDARVVASWPSENTPGQEADPAAAAGLSPEALREIKSAARAAITSGAARAFGQEKENLYYDSASAGGCILSIPLTVPVNTAPPTPGGQPQQGFQVVAVVGLLIEQRSKEAVRSTLAMAEVLAGYVHAHTARQQLRRTQAASFALDLATRLIASINTAPNFKGAAIQLTNDLTKQFNVDRVALGWVKSDTVRVEAISDTEHFDRRMAMVQKLQSAMDECLDQEQPVLFPQPPSEGPQGDVLLSQAIVHAHRELAASDSKLKVCSLPLRVDEKVVGVVTIESTGEGTMDLSSIEMIQAALDLVAPVLRIRRSDDRVVALRAWDSTIKGAAWLVGAKHTVWKLASVAAFIALVFCAVYTKPYRVGADVTLQPRVKRTVSAPFDGVIKFLHSDLEPGMIVKEGDVLVQLDTTDLEFSKAEAFGKMAQASAQQDAALKEKKAEEAAKARAQWQQAEAQYKYLDDRIERSKIRAPISGRVISGDLKNKVGGTIKLGDPLLEVADMSDIIAVAQVDDRDIWLVRNAFEQNTRTGSVLTKSKSAEPLRLEVERIVPMSQAKEGKNTFEVRAKLTEPAEWISPGMEGIAKLDTQRHSLLWIGSRRIVDAVRMWLW